MARMNSAKSHVHAFFTRGADDDSDATMPVTAGAGPFNKTRGLVSCASP